MVSLTLNCKVQLEKKIVGIRIVQIALLVPKSYEAIYSTSRIRTQQ